MKPHLLLLFFLLNAFSTYGQLPHAAYDSTLAARLGGDENGMKKYVLAILKTGTNKSTDKALIDSLFTGHMSNIQRLADAGQLVVAGPLGKNDKTYRGIFILNVDNTDEAGVLLQTDPAIAGGLLEPEVFVLWSTAALMQVPETHGKISVSGK